ncbi:MANS1 protein, partial [Campylorhamphus procurvoides]|nr:MANS1 protein [Campylorhamphus procurvoides]
LLAIASVLSGPCLGRECPAERMEGVTIDVELSLPRGVRGAEPLAVPAAGECVRACCGAGGTAGDKKCNLVIFYARRTSAHPNCYLFHCPTTEACLMKPAPGLVSYRITTDTDAPEDKSIKTENFSSNEYSLSSDAEAFISHSQNIHQNHTATLQQSVFHQASELLNHIGKHLDNIEFRTDIPESQKANQYESLDLTPRQKVIHLPPNTSSAVQIGTPTASFHTTHPSVSETSGTTLTPLPTSTAQLESPTTSLYPGGAEPTITTATSAPTSATGAKPAIPVSSIDVTHIPLSSSTTSTTKWVTTNSRSATTPSGLRTPAISPEPRAVSSKDTSHVTPSSFSGFILSTSDSPTSSQKDLQGYDPSDSEGNLSEGVLRGKGVVQLQEKSSLVAALLFGVIFLLVVIALTGKKIHESLQKRHYTRLDYLISGMYAD